MDYVNQAQVDKIAQKVREIIPNYGLDVELKKNVVTALWVSVPIKGNKKIIQKLEAMGFRRVRKMLEPQTDYWSVREHSRFILKMRKAVQETKLELEDL